MSRFSNSLKSYPKTFWVANTMELFERLAWYGIFMILALYLTSSKDEGALGFSQTQKGTLMGTISFVLYFLPLFTGAIADKFGYKKTLITSLIMKYKPINTIITGFLVSSIGIGLWFITQNGAYLFISILIFGLGEMASSPRILEYINKIAPKDKAYNK